MKTKENEANREGSKRLGISLPMGTYKKLKARSERTHVPISRILRISFEKVYGGKK